MEKLFCSLVLCVFIVHAHARAVDLLLSNSAFSRSNLEETRPDTKTVCYGLLGCFSNSGEFFDMFHRPIMPLPQSPSTIFTTFSLYTRNNTEEQFLRSWQPDTIIQSQFNASRKTKFIIHGYMDNSEVPWVKEMTRALLQVGDYNVITVDWVLGAVHVYQQAAVNARVVGAEIWYLCQQLSEMKGLKNEDVHLIGHSLGAHIAGYAGERMASLGRISGLDPAEPYFQGTDPVVRLDPTDADFVDVIHTDGDYFVLRGGVGGFGMSQPCGHVDFYPNGGTLQPECSLEDASEIANDSGILPGIWHLATCNHHRAIVLYTHSIISGCRFSAFPCSDYETFLKGECRCDNRCIPMGYYADRMDHSLRERNDNIYFLKTGGNPICRNNYIVTLKRKPNMESCRGQIYMDIESESPSRFTEVTDGPTEIAGNQSFVLMSNGAVNGDTVLRLKWVPQYTWLGLFGQTCRETLDIDVIEIQGHELRAEALRDVVVEADGEVSGKVRILLNV